MPTVLKYSHIPEEQVQTRADKRAIDEGCDFLVGKGEKVVRFIERFVRTTRGFGAGRAVKLLPWQRSFVIRCMSWVKPNGYRRFREAFLGIPRQNGKSFLCSALALY